MASETNAYFGFELLNSLVDNQLSKKEDVLILMLHWYLVKNSFKCLGLDDSKTFVPENNAGSELLPAEWNCQPNYNLRYAKDGKLYVILATKSDSDLLINLLRVDNNAVSNVQFPIEATVGSVHGTLDALVPSHRAVIEKIQKELIEPVYTGSAREISTQTIDTSEEVDRRRSSDDDPLRVRSLLRGSDRLWNPAIDPRNVGRADLHPCAPGGGMIYNPYMRFRGTPNPLHPLGFLEVPGRQPPGAVPPGARYDPFGPPDINVPRPPRNPDSDHDSLPGSKSLSFYQS